MKYSNDNGNDPVIYVPMANGRHYRRFLNTPAARRVAEKHFGPGVPGIEIERQGGGGSARHHLEKRAFMNDFMSPDAGIEDIVYSEFVLAALEDSGWYDIDYSYVSPTVWGKDQGLDFFDKPCIDEVLVDGVKEYKAIFQEFCDEETGKGNTCSFNRLNKAQCNYVEWIRIWQREYRYFGTNYRKGGSDVYADYCPYRIENPIDRGECRASEKNPDDPTTWPLSNPDYFEEFGPNSRCLEGTYKKGNTAEEYQHSGCHNVTCEYNQIIITINGHKFICPRSSDTENL